MSFLVIVPSDFVKVDIDAICGPIQWNINDLKRLEENQMYREFNEWLHKAGTLELEKNIVEIKIIEDRELYVKYE